MQYTRLGRTGLEVSRICLGMMSFGDSSKGREWTLGLDAARPIVRAAWEAGINFYDTANVYAAGTSEEVTGQVLWELAPRDEIVLATKVNGEMRKGPNGKGQSRKAILSEIDNSLRRLKTDYVDLYQIHRLDHDTPIEETLEALDEVVKSGKARYIGASSMFAWQFMKMLAVQKENGWSRFVIYREEEREMMPLCIDQGIGVIPWSPLARGWVARPWGEQTKRSGSDGFGNDMYKPYADSNQKIVNSIEQVAKAKGKTMAQVSLAWVMQKQQVSAPIVGVAKMEQLTDALGALEVSLTADEVKAVEANYVPRPHAGFN
jgi:aryl-alcohol dehydrogenase-like predicted oxidoreductase